jgi:uncharacterized iron-regulated membrane protein
MIRNCCKVFFGLLAISAFASRGLAQSNASPGGTNADAGREPASGQAEKPYLNAPDPHVDRFGDRSDDRFKQDLEKATAAQRAAANDKSLPGKAGLGLAGETDFQSTPAPRPFSQQTWIAIVGVAAILLSLGAGGYVWWSRSQRAAAEDAILALTPETLLDRDGTDEQDKPPQRRAA